MRNRTRQNIHVCLYSLAGIKSYLSDLCHNFTLKNFEEIVIRSLPLEKVAHYYEECSGAAKEVVLNYVTFFEQRISVS